MANDEKSLKIKLEKELKSLDADKPVERKLSPQPKPLIQRVTHILRDNKDFERYFKPISVAFGPVPHCDLSDPRLQRGEKHKLQMAAKFIKYSETKKEVFYSKVMTEIDVLKKCYDCKLIEKWKEEEELAWIFVVDGCATLLFIDHYANGNLKALKVKDDLLAYVKLDLFLLENQLPYQLLQILMSSCTRVPRDPRGLDENYEKVSAAEVLKASITIFINKNAMSPVEQEKQKLLQQQPQPQQHSEKLNDQTHQQQQQQQKQKQQQFKITIDQTQHHQQQQKQERDPAHLLELLWRRMTKSEDKESDGTMSMSKLLKKLCPSSNKESDRTTSKGKSSYSNPGDKSRHYRYTFRNVKELKEKGIWLKVSKTSSIKDISFQESFFLATLRLPPITVDDFTGTKLMNLIAFEMCPDFENKFEITSYMSFLDSLIDSREDVKELRDAGVLHNGLGSDKAVALLFNEISENLVPNPLLHFDLKCRIQAHCNTTFANYVAQLYHTYFRSPWSILAFLGVLLGLGMTAIQTYKAL